MMDRVDTDLLKSQVNLPELVLARAGGLKKISTSDGGVWRGPCPRCGGKDRFTVKGTGRWICNQCSPRTGDVFDFLAWWQGASFREAVDIVTRYAGMGDVPTLMGDAVARPPAPSGPRHLTEPTAEWRGRAEVYVARAEAHLWRYPALLERLEQTRGIEPETARTWRIGYWSQEWVWPAYYQGELFYVMRRSAAANTPARWLRYAGGEGCGLPYGADLAQGRDTLIVVEGHGDAVLLWQTVHAWADVVTLGGVGITESAEADKLFRSYKYLFAAHDADDAGDKRAAKFQEEYGAERLRPPVHKDWVDAWRAGYKLRVWTVGQVAHLVAQHRAVATMRIGAR